MNRKLWVLLVTIINLTTEVKVKGTLKDWLILAALIVGVFWLVNHSDRTNCRQVGKYGETICD
jgi:hypothetical protein